jgi:RimK family alpha-L-glutamate ligase
LPNVNLAAIVGGDISAIECDACVFLDKDRAAARLLEKSGVRLFNSAEGIEVCDDKMLTHIALSGHGISMPDTIYSPLCYYPDAEVNGEFLENVASTLKFPLVAKKCFGSLGAGVELIKDFDTLKNYEEENKLIAHFYQKMVGRGGEDTRVIVIGKKVVCAMKRSNKNDFRSNIELGGIGTRVTPDNELVALSEKCAGVLNLDYCGIDILTDESGKKYVCEVNSNAFFAAAEKVCNVNIAKTYAEYIVKSLSLSGEFEDFKKNPSAYKKYSTFKEAVDDVLDDK